MNDPFLILLKYLQLILIDIHIDTFFERICQLHYPFKAGLVSKLAYSGLIFATKKMRSLTNSDDMKMLTAAQRAGIFT